MGVHDLHNVASSYIEANVIIIIKLAYYFITEQSSLLN